MTFYFLSVKLAVGAVKRCSLNSLVLIHRLHLTWIIIIYSEVKRYASTTNTASVLTIQKQYIQRRVHTHTEERYIDVVFTNTHKIIKKKEHEEIKEKKNEKEFTLKTATTTKTRGFIVQREAFRAHGESNVKMEDNGNLLN